jgi:16S rRNA (adenine1518-N6/adenine1519-N6)-dimethyltransferase
VEFLFRIKGVCAGTQCKLASAHRDIIMKLSDIRLVLAERGWKLTKSLGQNFLHDQNQLQRIVRAAEIGPADKILEIGPGLGPLTELLVSSAGETLAIEKDRRLFDYLSQKFAFASNLKLIHADALEYVKANRRWGGWKLAANLPYSVASPLLVELAWAEEPPERMTATLQLEVAQRIGAPTGSEHYGLLGLLLRLRYESGGWFKIPATCFFPAPEVDSACIVLARRTEPLLAAALHGAFARIVKRGFSQRRKMMFKLLKQDWPEDALRRGFAEASLAPQTRAEEVSLEQFARLTEAVAT